MSEPNAAEQWLAEHSRLLSEMRQHAGTLQAIGQTIVRTLQNGHCVLACGNGGSAAQADHLVGELVGRFQKVRRALPAINLTGAQATLTSLANDFSYEEAFTRQIEAFGRGGDALVALSTSGVSPNVVRAARVAKEMGLTVIGLAGKDGGALAGVADPCLIVPSQSTAHIQEIHLLAIHLICAMVDQAFEKPAAAQ